VTNDIELRTWGRTSLRKAERSWLYNPRWVAPPLLRPFVRSLPLSEPDPLAPTGSDHGRVWNTEVSTADFCRERQIRVLLESLFPHSQRKGEILEAPAADRALRDKKWAGALTEAETIELDRAVPIHPFGLRFQSTTIPSISLTDGPLSV
jgi:hypothetical protein